MVAGYIAEKYNKYSIVLSFRDVDGKRRQKWYTTGLPVKNNKRRVEQLLEDVKAEFSRLEQENVPQESISSAMKVFISEFVERAVGIHPKAERIAPMELEERQGNYSHIPVVNSSTNKQSDILFSEYLTSWLRSQKRRVEPSTYISYGFVIERRVAPYFYEKGILLKDLSARDIHEYYSFCIEKGLKTESVLKHHANIRKALQQAIDDDLIDSIVLAKLKRPQKPKSEKFRGNYYKADEINELLEAVKGDPIELIVKIACFYGLRRGEILGLRWESIDFDRKTITINSTASQYMSEGKYVILLKDRTKNESSMRTLPLVDKLADELLIQKERLLMEKQLARGSYSREYQEYVFLDPLGSLYKPNYVTTHFKHVLVKKGLRVIRFHDLRHSCASLLLANGVPMKAIQEWLGHSNFSTTADIYSHLDFKSKEVSANAMANSGVKLF